MYWYFHFRKRSESFFHQYKFYTISQQTDPKGKTSNTEIVHTVLLFYFFKSSLSVLHILYLAHWAHWQVLLVLTSVYLPYSFTSTAFISPMYTQYSWLLFCSQKPTSSCIYSHYTKGSNINDTNNRVKVSLHLVVTYFHTRACYWASV